MKPKATGFWVTLEAVPGVAAVDAEWKGRFGHDYEAARNFLRPNGEKATSHPCTIPRGCGCHHEVIVHGHEDLVAVCRCERGCDTFPLEPAEIVVYEVDRAALDAAVVAAFGLLEEPATPTDLYGTTRLGVYSPYAGYRFPIYLTLQLEADDFNAVLDGLLARNDTPFVLIAPTRELCTASAEKRLTDRQSSFVALSESVALEAQATPRLLRPLDELLAPLRAAHLPAPKGNGLVFFPTPADTTWSDVSIRFKDGYTVSVKAKAAAGVFNYTQMGMANKKNGDPTVQWDLLHDFADAHGVFDWSNPHAHRRNQKRREILAAHLQAFFRIDGDPFRLTADGQGWEARFRITPDA